MKPQRFLIYAVFGLVVALSTVTARAQWHWLDDQGRKVFSDRGPGPEVPEKNILKRPGAPATAPLLIAPVASEPTGLAKPNSAGREKVNPNAATPASAPVSADAKKAADEFAKQKQKLEQEQKVLKAQNCVFLKRQLNSLKAGTRVSRFNEKGERYFLDENTRATEIEQIQQSLAGCN
jgi:hypothetical protein